MVSRRRVIQWLALAMGGCGGDPDDASDARSEDALARLRARFDLACTIAAAGGRLVSNSDNPLTTRTQLVVVEPPRGRRYIASRIVAPDGDPPPWDGMPSRGVNEAGFAYTWSHVRPVREPDSLDPTLSGRETFAAIGHELLATARWTADAIAIIEGSRRAFHGNFLFADANGDVRLVEASTESLVVVPPDAGIVVRTNHWETGRMRDICATPAASSTHRLARARAILAETNAVDRLALERLAADHDAIDRGLSICVHNGSFGTVGSEISEPESRTFWFCYGWPCADVERRRAVPSTRQRASWGRHLPFRLDDLEAGEYTTIDGTLTDLARRRT
jgi:hypothetical protein